MTTKTLADPKKKAAKADFQAVERIKDMPLLILQNIVLFPENTVPLASLQGLRPYNLQALQKGNLKVGVVTRINAKDEKKIVVSGYGTEAIITGLLKLPNGELGALLKGTRKFVIHNVKKEKEGFWGKVTIIQDLPLERTETFLALIKAIKNLVLKLLKLNPALSQEAVALLYATEDPGLLGDVIVPHLSLTVQEKLFFLSCFDVNARMRQLLTYLTKEIDLLEISTKIQDEVKGDIHDNFKRNFLREQMQIIKKELSELGDEVDEISRLQDEIKKLPLPPEAREATDREFDRLGMMHNSSPEYMVAWTYLTWIKDLPWALADEQKQIAVEIDKAKSILEAHHFGLTKVKERILEYIAVIQHKKSIPGQVLLLVGPPGVGKSSLAKSIAKSLNRPFVKVSLGGVKDEAEIRGHRRTYIGSLPGKIIQALKEAKAMNPVILLDEIDKAGASNVMGDVSSALLEVLDPEQNARFVDHYLSVPYDLSQVIFVATANTTRSISAPLLDRMEAIELSGYTESEKSHIAHKHLIPRMQKEMGLLDSELAFSSELLQLIIRHYTREAGVRQLDRQIHTIGRKHVRQLVEKKTELATAIPPQQLLPLLGVPRYHEEPRDQHLPAGVAVGLAYTAFGGDILYIESRKSMAQEGRGKLMLTGSLGKVMQESAQAVYSFLLSYAEAFGFDRKEMEQSTIHVHLPDGATPKDGPSAGVALLCTLASLFSGKSLPSNLAMTGEITLRGQVLAVGGIKEKLIAAHRYRKTKVIIPTANWLDLEDLPAEVLNDLEIFPVSDMNDVLSIAGLIPAGIEQGEIAPQKFIKGVASPFSPEGMWQHHLPNSPAIVPGLSR
jgi:ATP-dependent Lon protease